MPGRPTWWLSASVLAIELGVAAPPTMAQMPQTYTDSIGIPHAVQPVWCIGGTCSGGGAGGSLGTTASPSIVGGSNGGALATDGSNRILASIVNSSLAVTQSGSWSVGVSSLPAVTGSVSLTGSLPAFAAPPTVNCGTGCYPSTQAITGTVTANEGGAPWSVSWSGQSVAATQSGAWAVSCTAGCYQTTQPVSGTVGISLLPALPAGSNAIGSVSVSNFPATQPISDAKDGQSSDEMAVRAGTGFTASTLLVAVGSGNYLNVILTNPAGSGKYLIIQGRQVANSSTSVLTYTSRTNPTALTSPTTVTPSNRYTGNAITSVASLTYNTSTSTLSGGTAVRANIVQPQNYTSTIVIRIIPPGYSLGLTVGGVGGVLTTASSIAVNIWWDEVTAP